MPQLNIQEHVTRALLEQHMTDYAIFREDLNRNMKDLANEIKTLTRNQYIVFGGLILAGKLLDYITAIHPFTKGL